MFGDNKTSVYVLLLPFSGLELSRCAVSILDSMIVVLIEPPFWSFFSSSPPTARGLAEVYQKRSRLLVRRRECTGRHTLTVTNFTGSA